MKHTGGTKLQPQVSICQLENTSASAETRVFPTHRLPTYAQLVVRNGVDLVQVFHGPGQQGSVLITAEDHL
jgi:hypothetical protein